MICQIYAPKESLKIFSPFIKPTIKKMVEKYSMHFIEKYENLRTKPN